jgi:hypothetical protein
MQFSKATVITFGKSRKIEKPNENPGAGLYNPKDKSLKRRIPDYKYIVI